MKDIENLMTDVGVSTEDLDATTKFMIDDYKKFLKAINMLDKSGKSSEKTKEKAIAYKKQILVQIAEKGDEIAEQNAEAKAAEEEAKRKQEEEEAELNRKKETKKEETKETPPQKKEEEQDDDDDSFFGL